MKRLIELKNVMEKERVRLLIDDLLDRLEDRLSGIPGESISVHVMFEENGTHSLFRTSISCHLPGRLLATHEEKKEAGFAIREAFREIERQIAKQNARLRKEHMRRRENKKGQDA